MLRKAVSDLERGCGIIPCEGKGIVVRWCMGGPLQNRIFFFQNVLLQLGLDALQLFFDYCVWPRLYIR